jgi:hypothetical protein
MTFLKLLPDAFIAHIKIKIEIIFRKLGHVFGVGKPSIN